MYKEFDFPCIKDPWTKPKGGRSEGEGWGWVGGGKMVARKGRQLYLNNNKKKCWKLEKTNIKRKKMIFLYNSTGLTLEKIIKNVFQCRASLLLAK